MEKKNSMGEQVIRFQNTNNKETSVERKMDELIVLMKESNLDSNAVDRLQQKFNTAVDKSREADKFKAFERLDDSLSSRLEMADNLENLLSTYQVDSKASKKYLFAERLLKFVQMLTAVVLMACGFALIILPAPPEFEMFTIVYFTTDDGFTLMDLIALGIVLAGVYLFVRSFIRTSNSSTD